MRVTEMIDVPASKKEVLAYIKCELCGAISKRDDWSQIYNVTEPEVTLREGTNYPEGGCITTTRLDICPNCFKQKLIPWFVAQGGTPRVDENDW